jgi:hypothetical protein
MKSANPEKPPYKFETPCEHERMAEWYHEMVESLQEEEQKGLGPDENLVSYIITDDGGRIYPRWLGYQNPAMIVVKGMNQNSEDTTLLIGYEQLQVIMIKTKKEIPQAPHNPLGFQLRGETTVPKQG